MMRLVVVLSALLVIGCTGSPAAPKARDELACGDAPPTPASFGTVTVLGDTVRWTNRFIEPHHWADTVRVAVAGFRDPMLVISTHGGRCTTLSDSLIIFGTERVIL